MSAGHSDGSGASKDRGAKVVGTDYWEGDLAIIVRDKIADRLRAGGFKVMEDRNSDALAQTFNFFKALVRTDSINIDIHFNSHVNPRATGTECFIKSLDVKNGWQIAWANRFCYTISAVLGIPNRGVKSQTQSARGRLGWMQLTGNNFLFEIAFVSNSQDVRKFFDNLDLLADRLAADIGDCATS